MWLLAYLISCVTPKTQHAETITADGVTYDCLCNETKKEEPVMSTEAGTKYATYTETYECKCRERVKVETPDFNGPRGEY